MDCKVMGIVNVTPDSFSDGGKYFKPEEALKRAVNMIAEGAGIIDFGGESTRPGSEPIGWEEEWSRLEGVFRGFSGIAALRRAGISVDTYHPETAERALAHGATIVNCVYAASVPDMLRVCGRAGASLVVPFRLPGVAEDEGGDVLRALPETDVPLYLDPMVGFGTTREGDLALLGSVPAMARRGTVLVGASRKRIVKKLVGGKVAGKDTGGSVGIALWAAARGASVVRVHDVGDTVRALRVFEACESSLQAFCDWKQP